MAAVINVYYFFPLKTFDYWRISCECDTRQTRCEVPSLKHCQNQLLSREEGSRMGRRLHTAERQRQFSIWVLT